MYFILFKCILGLGNVTISKVIITTSYDTNNMDNIVIRLKRERERKNIHVISNVLLLRISLTLNVP